MDSTHIGRTICHLLLFVLGRTMCCLRQLFMTWEFSSTVMLICSLTSRVQCRDLLLCYDSSAASDVQCPTLCSIHWSCHWMPHLDYGNATLTGLPASQLHRLQSVLNAVARLIHRSSQYEHITPMLQELHWLRSPEHINFKSWLCSFIDTCMVWR